MAQITQLHTVTATGGSYVTITTFNGLPPVPPLPLSYDTVAEEYTAALVGEGTQSFIHTSLNAGTHLGSYNPEDLAHINYTQGSPERIKKGGVVIKTTAYPPPFNRKLEDQLNANLLADLEIKELKIERSGTGQNFTVSGVIGNKPGRNRSFSIHPNSAFISGPNSRARELMDIQIAASGNTSNKTFSMGMSGATDLSHTSPCCVILREAGTIHPSFDYSKSAWFYLLP